MLVRLPSAPFPYDADPRRGEPPFFTGRDPKSGERFRIRAKVRFMAGRHYSDGRVLIHIPPGFDPAKPLRFVVFFHGHRATLARDVAGRYGLPHQITASGRNVVLIAPQLAHDAIDSHPGKLARQNGLADLLAEAEAVVARETGADPERLSQAPVILSGFSGGYAAVASSLSKGGIGGRVSGIVLLDALFGAHDTFVSWFAANDQRAFLIVVYGASTVQSTDRLMADFRARDVTYALRWPVGELGEDDNLFLRVDTPHLDIPAKGPPMAPLAEVLRRLPPFESFARVPPPG